MHISLPKNVKKVIRILEEQGYEGYAVGGCVRDSLLGREPDDWDITTSAKPEEMKALFRKTIDTGIAHGTVTVLLDGEGYEVTTYRIDGEYPDARHPKEVVFTGNLIEDLRRRDFTINAMAYNESNGMVDAFGGTEDLEEGVIRCVGEASERFTEDALRILRAVRFSAQLGFTIEENTKHAIGKLARNLHFISAERIQVELVKLLISNHPEYLKTAWETGITSVILPEFDEMMKTKQNNPHHRYTVGEHTLAALQEIENDKVLRLAVLFHDVGKPSMRTVDSAGIDHFYGHADKGTEISRNILCRLKFDNDTIYKVTKLVKYHDLHPALTDRSVRKLIHKVGEDIFPLLLKIQKADILSQSHYMQEDKLRNLEEVGHIYQYVLLNKDCLSLKTLAVSGKDLIADGMKPGKEIGNVLDHLLSHVLDEPDCNVKDYLIEYSREFRE